MFAAPSGASQSRRVPAGAIRILTTEHEDAAGEQGRGHGALPPPACQKKRCDLGRKDQNRSPARSRAVRHQLRKAARGGRTHREHRTATCLSPAQPPGGGSPELSCHLAAPGWHLAPGGGPGPQGPRQDGAGDTCTPPVPPATPRSLPSHLQPTPPRAGSPLSGGSGAPGRTFSSLPSLAPSLSHPGLASPAPRCLRSTPELSHSTSCPRPPARHCHDGPPPGLLRHRRSPIPIPSPGRAPARSGGDGRRGEPAPCPALALAAPHGFALQRRRGLSGDLGPGRRRPPPPAPGDARAGAVTALPVSLPPRQGLRVPQQPAVPRAPGPPRGHRQREGRGEGLPARGRPGHLR